MKNICCKLKHANLATKADIKDFIQKADFDNKLKKPKRKVTSNKPKQVEAKKKITDLTNKFVRISGIRYEFLLGRMCFVGDDGYQTFLVYAPMLSSLILDSNEKVTAWI